MMVWQLRYALSIPYLLAATAFMLPSVPRPLQTAFQVQSGMSDWDEGWNLPLSPNSTHHLIFNSVSGLLHRWPNSLRSRRNGHSLVPATVPKGTILYHGRNDARIPSSPDWLAFDFEHAFLFCFGPDYVITLQVKRDLRLLYFDGSSAAKMKGGTMDSQDVILWGRPQPDKFFSEGERIKALCDWGRPFGLGGFVRMEFHFEVILCDFSDAMEVITSLNVVPKNQSTMRSHFPGVPTPMPPPSQPKPPPGWLGSLPNGYRVFSEAYLSGSWHDHAPGETRVHLDYAGFVTFYDTSLTSLVEARYRKDRMHLRLEGISALDSERVRAELQTVLTREREGGSGIDWGSIVRVVMERYGTRLEYLRFLLSSNTTSFVDELERAAAARAQLLSILTPYIATTDVPKQLPPSANLSWAAPIAYRCAMTQTSHIPLGMLTRQEARIHAAVESTLREICRRLVLVWVEFFDVEAADEAKATDAIKMARGHVEELMTWLDWSMWVRCEPGCSLGEICYLPSWPFILGGDADDTMPYCVSLPNVIPP